MNGYARGIMNMDIYIEGLIFFLCVHGKTKNNALVFNNSMSSLLFVLTNVLFISHDCLFQIQIDEDIFAHHEVVQLKANLKTYLNLRVFY
jgi:hypothetical protein